LAQQSIWTWSPPVEIAQLQMLQRAGSISANIQVS
jgi:hypothetical protein